MAEVAEEDDDEEDAHDDADDDDDPELELRQSSCQHRFWQKKKNHFLVDLYFEKWAYDPKEAQREIIEAWSLQCKQDLLSNPLGSLLIWLDWQEPTRILQGCTA